MNTHAALAALFTCALLLTLPPHTAAAAAAADSAVAARPLPSAVTVGALTQPPDHEQVTAMHKHHRPPGKTTAPRRAVEMTQLRAQIARAPDAKEHADRLLRLGELEHDEIHWRHFLSNRARQEALVLAAKERARMERKRKRYEFKVDLSRRRNWSMPVKPNLTPTVVVPPETTMDVRPAIARLEPIIKRYPHFARMDAVLLLVGTMRIYQGQRERNLSGVAIGQHYLEQLLHEFHDSALAPKAGVRLADLALAQGDTVHAREYLEELAEEVRSGELHEYALYRLAWLKAVKSLPDAVAQLRSLGGTAKDPVIRQLAVRDAVRLSKLLPRATR